jgi:glycosyltransferase involved in cell wall biosynthesis
LDTQQEEAVLHIGIEAGDLLRSHRAGMARYTHSLLAALSHSALPVKVRPWAPRRRMLGLLKSSLRPPVHFFSEDPPRVRPDIFHATACVFPAWKSPVEIVTVHDLYAVREELNISAEEKRRRTDYIHRADRIICVSQFTRAHLHALFDVPEDKTVAIPLTAHDCFKPASAERQLRLQRRYGLPTEFLLFVGRYRTNKNLDGLLAAYAASSIRIPLYIVGTFNKQEYELTMRIAANVGCADRIGWLNAVDESELPTLLSCASALCLPSTFEGFGLPIIEAMACGTPVLTSAGRATEETAGGHAVLVDPDSVESIADGLHRVLEMTDTQRTLAREYAARRTWDDVAAETWQVYAQAYRGASHTSESLRQREWPLSLNPQASVE